MANRKMATPPKKHMVNLWITSDAYSNLKDGARLLALSDDDFASSALSFFFSVSDSSPVTAQALRDVMSETGQTLPEILTDALEIVKNSSKANIERVLHLTLEAATGYVDQGLANWLPAYRQRETAIKAAQSYLIGYVKSARVADGLVNSTLLALAYANGFISSCTLSVVNGRAHDAFVSVMLGIRKET